MTLPADTPLLDRSRIPWIVGHRGAAGTALENTLTAIEAGLSEQADMLELDVQISTDGVPVLFHDWDLRRLAGRSDIIERSDVKALAAIKLPNPYGEETERIPQLASALSAIPASTPLNLELKRRFRSPRELIDALAPIVDRRSLLLSSFDWNLLSELRRELPRVPLAPLGRWKAEEILAIADELDAFSVHAHRELAGELVAHTKRPVLAYTVNDPEEARRLLDRGVTGIFTDAPGALRNSLDLQ